MKSQSMKMFLSRLERWAATGCLLLTLALSHPAIIRAQEKQPPADKADGAAPHNPALRLELLQMSEADQDVRKRISAQLKNQKKPEPELVAELNAVDTKNTARLKQIIETYGWPGERLVGKDGAHAAWLLVQHADRDRPFQKRCLELLNAAAGKGEASMREVAYLTDRVLVGAGKKQLYGTQFGPNDQGAYVPRPIEDEQNVDERRKSVGLPSLEEYKKQFFALYGDAVKKAPEKKDAEIKLFNGKDFTGWTFHLRDPDVKMEDVWSVDPAEGIIICKGKPNGYIRTEADYTNYVLKLEWRFNPVTKKAGNSGVLLRIVGPDKVWPKSVEAQLQSGAAGDFWLIDGARLDTPQERVDKKTPRHRLRAKTNEKPIGEWNEYEITCDGGKITLKVNGEVLNEGANAEVVPGKIGLQSEGSEIHFRNIRLLPLHR